MKVLHSICQQTWKTQQWPQDWKRSVFTPIPKKGNSKECSSYCIISLISHTRKILLKILQARLQQYVNHELTDVQAGFRKGRGIRDQIANIHWIIKKAREFQKNNYYLEKTLESSLDCKEIQPGHPNWDQSWVFIGRTDAEAETPILWPPDVESWLIG